MAKGKGSKTATAAAATAPTEDATVPATTKLERHPLSEEFALPMSDEEQLALATDMQHNGQLQEVLLYQGKVLEGWGRYMACLQKGLTVRTKEYTGEAPVAAIFSANAVRRKLSSVQKAFFAARYYMHLESQGGRVSQKDVAKMGCVSLTKMNEVVQLLRSDHPKAKSAVEALRTNPDVSSIGLQTMLVDAGIIDPNERKQTTPAANAPAIGDPLPDDEGDDNDVDDLVGGADIDDLLDDDDDATPVRVSGKGENVIPLNAGGKGGGRVGHNHRATETPASATAKSFKALTEPERLDFVKFAWAVLRPAVEKAMADGRIEWPAQAAHADPSKAAMADIADVLAPKVKGTKAGKAKTVDALATMGAGKAETKPAKRARKAA